MMIEFVTICERAKMSPDSPLADADIAARYRRFYGVMISGKEVRRARQAFEKRMREAPSVTLKVNDDEQD